METLKNNDNTLHDNSIIDHFDDTFDKEDNDTYECIAELSKSILIPNALDILVKNNVINDDITMDKQFYVNKALNQNIPYSDAFLVTKTINQNYKLNIFMKSRFSSSPIKNAYLDVSVSIHGQKNNDESVCRETYYGTFTQFDTLKNIAIFMENKIMYHYNYELGIIAEKENTADKKIKQKLY